MSGSSRCSHVRQGTQTFGSGRGAIFGSLGALKGMGLMVNLLEKIYPSSMLHLVAFSNYLSKQLLCRGTFQGIFIFEDYVVL